MITFDIDGVPPPSDIELAAMDAANAKRREFKPFVGIVRNRLVTIIGETHGILLRDAQGYLHPPEYIDRDLDAYAERMRAECQDQDDTQQDALW